MSSDESRGFIPAWLERHGLKIALAGTAAALIFVVWKKAEAEKPLFKAKADGEDEVPPQ